MIDPALRRAIVVAYRSMSAKEVGELYGVDHQTVLNSVRAAGEPVRWKHLNGGSMVGRSAA